MTHLDAGVVFNLLIECPGGEDTSDDPPEGKSKTLFEIADIPAVTFSLGGVPVSVKPVLALTAGVEANIPTRLALPLQSAFTVGMEMGWDRSLVTSTRDGYFYQPVTDFVPARVSDPTVFDELAATLGFWTQLDVGLEIEAGSGITVDAGPRLGIRLQNDYRLAPIADPWWEIDLGLDLIGQFAVDLDLMGFADIQLLDATSTLHHFDLFHRDAGGPLTGRAQRATTTTAPTTTPRSGQSVRWGRLFQPRANFQGFRQAFVFAVPGSDGDILAGGYNAHSILARFTRNGDVVWMKDTYPFQTIHTATPLPDGSFFAAGTSNLNVVFARYDSDGNPIWTTTYTPSPGFVVEAVAARTNALGQPEYYAAGRLDHSTIRTSDAALIRLDPDGEVVWANYYAHSGDDEALGIALTADGDLVLSGFTHEIVQPPPYGIPFPGNVLKSASHGGLLMKVDAATGAPQWATVCPAAWGLSFNRVTEGPDGILYAAGASSRPISLDRPSSVFARFTPEGTLIDHVAVGSDPDWPVEIANAGRTPYDSVNGLTWTPEGLVACGQSGLGTHIVGWVMGLTQNLGVKYYSVFDGIEASPFLDIADVGDGLAVVGDARSPFPIPGQTGQRIPWLLKLPWEGILRFNNATGFRSLFLQPWTHHSSASHEFQTLSSIIIPKTEGIPRDIEVFYGNASGPISLEPQPLLLTAQPNATALNTATEFTSLALEEAPPRSFSSYSEWATAYGLPTGSLPDTDTDEDGLSDGLEAYFGRDPTVAETTPLFTISHPDIAGPSNVAIEFCRTTYARGWGGEIQTSLDLVTWSALTGAPETIVALDSVTERVVLEIAPSPEARRFFRAAYRPSAVLNR